MSTRRRPYDGHNRSPGKSAKRARHKFSRRLQRFLTRQRVKLMT